MHSNFGCVTGIESAVNVVGASSLEMALKGPSAPASVSDFSVPPCSLSDSVSVSELFAQVCCACLIFFLHTRYSQNNSVYIFHLHFPVECIQAGKKTDRKTKWF